MRRRFRLRFDGEKVVGRAVEAVMIAVSAALAGTEVMIAESALFAATVEAAFPVLVVAGTE